MTDLSHISPPNEKTECYSFDLPAKTTCPGMTKACDKCYAFNLMQAYPAVDAKYLRNLEFADSEAFVTHMVRSIPKRCEFRIHVSGDFYSLEYIANWRKIIAARPDVTFYAYTRSWMIPELWSKLRALHVNFENVNINLSVDEFSGPPKVFGASVFRWVYMTIDDTEPNWMRKGDVTLRATHIGHKRKRKNDRKKGIDPNIRAPLLHSIGKATVCPMQRGRDLPKTFTCSTCELCVTKPSKEKAYAV